MQMEYKLKGEKEMSQMINCKACGKEIAKGVKKCPHCGKDQRNFFMKHKIITGVLILVILVGIGSALGNKSGDTSANNSKSTSKNNSNASAPKEEKTKVTYDNFLKIKMGDKYENVVAILGEGKEQTSSEVSGVKTAIYEWNGSGLSNMNVTIQNGVVTGKAQIGLTESDAKITLEKYNQVKDGMTYDQVKAILGEGQITSQTKIMDIESIIYTWTNKDGSNMNCTFTSGKMALKAQFDLK